MLKRKRLYRFIMFYQLPFSRTLNKLIFFLIYLLLGFNISAEAHEIRPAIADVIVSETNLLLEFRLNAEALIAGVNLQGVTNTDDSVESEKYNRLRALSSPDLAALFKKEWPGLQANFTVLAGEKKLILNLGKVFTARAESIDVSRDTIISLSTSLPFDNNLIRIGWLAAYGPLILRQITNEEVSYSSYLANGDLSEGLPRVGKITQSKGKVFYQYIVVGYNHIIPKGIDHILFVLGLFFLSSNLRQVILQVSFFTVAHTLTLALSSLGLIFVPSAIVEPLIALSICYIAIENIFTSKIMWWRPIMIFLFGLLHGLGFAAVLGDIGFSPSLFWISLVGFNLGVELGQVMLLTVMFIMFGYYFGSYPWYRSRICIPASVFIAAAGGYWFIERVTFLT